MHGHAALTAPESAPHAAATPTAAQLISCPLAACVTALTTAPTIAPTIAPITMFQNSPSSSTRVTGLFPQYAYALCPITP